jgi:hypothetical protein
VANLAATARGYTDGGLPHSTGYDYRVRATRIPDLGPSNEVAVRTLPPQVERVRLSTDWSEKFRFRGSGSSSAPPGARILNVRNITLGKDNAQLTVREVEHSSADLDLRSHAQLGYNATTSVFNGQLAKGSWSLWVSSSGAFLWDCDGLPWSSYACNEVDVIVGVEVTWA